MTEKIVAELNNKFDEAEQFRAPYDRTWKLNYDFVMGRQWGQWNEKKKVYEPSPAPSWKFRSTTNRIFPVVRTLINKIVDRKFDITVIPKKSDKDAVDTSEIAKKVIEYVFSKYYKAYDIAFDLLVYGKSFLKVHFDPDVGDIIDTGDTQIKVGDIVMTHLSPFEVYIDPFAINIEEAKYCFIVRVRSRQYIKDKYNIDVNPTSITLPLTLHTFFQESFSLEDAVLVKEYYERSSPDHPEGRHIIMANDTILKSDENPYTDTDGTRYIPIVSFDFFVTNKQLYGPSLVEQLIPLQKEYNELKSELVMHEKLLARGKWLIPINCGVPKSSITSEPGEKIYYDPRHGTPTPIPGVPPPPALWQHFAVLKQEFDDLAGVHEISRGRVPSGVRSYVAIAFLQEQDDTLLAITRNNMVESFCKAGYMIIKQAKQFFTEDRLLEIVGKDNKLELYTFERQKYKDVSQLTLSVIEGTSLPHSAVARQQFVLTLWQMGIIKDPAKILKLLEMPSAEQVFTEEYKLDEINAKMENEEMSKNIAMAVQEFDDHAVHLKIHNDYRKSLDFENLPEGTQELFRIHCETHSKLLDLQTMKFMELQGQFLPKKERMTQ